jgi:hypothetical protein
VPAAGPDQRPFSRDLARQPDGKILVSGFTSNTRTDTTDVPQMILARVTPDGELDPSFGDGGVARFAYYPGGLYRSFGGLAIAPDGKILAAGDVQRPPGDDLAVYRFLGDAVQPPPPPPPPAEVWTIQAEDADALGGTVVASNHVGYTGRGFIDFIGNSGAGAGWTINDTPGAGTYTIEFRYANGSNAARDMTLDASPARPVGPVSFAPTGGWAKWATKTVTVTMAQGIPTLEFSLATTGQNGPNIDSIKVSYQPLAGKDQQYQAEQARLVGARALSSHAGFTGTGYADFTNASGDSIEWDVSPHEGGRHEIVFRYANGAASDRPLQLSLNGDVITGRLSFAPTGSWSTWREISMEVNLADAGNRLRLATVGNNGPNIDVLTVRPL